MKIHIIVAATEDGLIGIDGKIPWAAKDAPGDLKRFRELTEGHLVIMGRKTAESLPMGCLPKRTNLILTRDIAWKPNPRLPRSAGAVVPPIKVVHTVGEALFFAAHHHDVYVIGGAEVIEHFLPHADCMRLTVIQDGPWREGLDESNGTRIALPEGGIWMYAEKCYDNNDRFTHQYVDIYLKGAIEKATLNRRKQ